MEEWLNDRLLQGKDYQRQALEEDENFNDEEDKEEENENSPNKENKQDSKSPLKQRVIQDDKVEAVTEDKAVQRKAKVLWRNKAYTKLIFDLKSESQQETVFFNIPDIIKDSYTFEKWKLKRKFEIDIKDGWEELIICTIRQSGIAVKKTTPKIIFKEINPENQVDIKGHKTLLIEYILQDNRDQESKAIFNFENYIKDISFLVELEHSSGVARNQQWNELEIEPDEKEIISFGKRESLDIDRCINIRISSKSLKLVDQKTQEI